MNLDLDLQFEDFDWGLNLDVTALYGLGYYATLVSN